jgi:hypothetical protein
MYRELRLLEDEMASARGAGRDTRAMVAQLDRLEEQANHLKVRSHIRKQFFAGAGWAQADLFLGTRPQRERRRTNS